jgi:hypothetical protein
MVDRSTPFMSEMLFFLCGLCDALRDPLCLNALKLNTKDTKACTKVHKGLLVEAPGKRAFFDEPEGYAIPCIGIQFRF